MDQRLLPIIETTNTNRASFEAFCRSLTPAELASPVPDSHWTARDFIAHLVTIDTWVGDWFANQAEGKPWFPRAADGSAFNIDTWNEEQVVPRREKSVDELLAEGAQYRAPLLATWERFTPETLDAPFDFRGAKITFLRYLELWSGHDPAHALDMLRGLSSRTARDSWPHTYRFPV